MLRRPRRPTPVLFAACLLLGGGLNAAFLLGDLSEPAQHDVRMLFAALLANVVATVVQLGDRTHIGAMQLATDLVVDVQLAAAAVVWFVGGHGHLRLPSAVADEVLSLSGGAFMASVVSVGLLVVVTLVDGVRSR